MVDFSMKQKDVWKNTIDTLHRWNISYGATRSGKTYLDYYKIPYRIRHAGDEGLILLLGNTKGTLQRNILDPMRAIWTKALVGDIGSDNKVNLFGRECWALGADKINQVSKIQGAGLSYCYGDEITTWNENIFQMLKSRLDKPGSCFDGTCNPDNPQHWFKKFLDSDADIYKMGFTLDDNPFLDSSFITNLKREYQGTVYYDRFILGLWKPAEGLIYRQFADEPGKWIIDTVDPGKIDFISIGVDFGGNRSLTTFVATAIMRNFSELVVLRDHHIKGAKGEIDADRVAREFVSFIKKLQADYPSAYVKYGFADSEEQYLIATLRKALFAAGLGIKLGDSDKHKIVQRIVCTNTLLNQNRLKLLRCCTLVRSGLEAAVWDSKAAEKGKDVRLDDFSTDIDILDAFEYSFERFMKKLVPEAA